MKEKSYHFNWIDALVCLLIAALVLGAFYKFVVSDKTSAVGAADKITYVVKLPDAKDYTIDSVQVGDAIFDSDSGNQVGVVTAIEVAPAQSAIALGDGTAQWGELAGKNTLYLTVEATGVVTDSREYLVNRTYQINVGSERNLNTRYRSFLGVIWAIVE